MSGAWNPFGLYGGIRIMETPLMTVGPFEDWSQVRSHGRAARRRKKHPQRIRLYYKPDPKVMHDRVNNVIYGHPVTLAALRQATDARRGGA